MTEFLSSSIQSFLVRHGFTARSKKSTTHETSDSPPRKRTRLDFEDDSGYAEVLPEEDVIETVNMPPAPLNLYAVRLL